MAKALAARPSSTAFDLRPLAHFATILQDGEAERLTLSDGFRRIRVDVTEGTLLDGPVPLQFAISDDHRVGAQIRSLQQFRAFCRRRVFGQALHPRERHAAQWINQLRAFDATEDGVSEREIAMTLFPRRFSNRDWRADEALRSSTRRLIAGARRTIAGRYLTLLS